MEDLEGIRDDRYSLEGCTELDEGYFSNSKQLETNEFTGKTEVLKRGKGSQKKSTVLVMNSFKSTTLSLISKKYKHQLDSKVSKDESN